MHYIQAWITLDRSIKDIPTFSPLNESFGKYVLLRGNRFKIVYLLYLYDIAEILLKVALSNIKQMNKQILQG
jgi:hypothetical protein